MSHINEVVHFDPKTGNWSYHVTYDHSWLIEENRKAQEDPNNGWTQDRTMRRIGKIPYELYVDPDFQVLTTAEKQLFLRWFLDKNPQFRTVDKVLHMTPNEKYIIVK